MKKPQVVNEAKVHFPVDADDNVFGISGESVWANKVGEDLYQLDSIPFCIPSATLGDIVQAKPRYGVLTFTGLVEESDNSLLWVLVDDESKVKRILRRLVSLGCEAERADDNYLGVNVPPTANLAAVRDYLDCETDKKTLDYCEPIVRQNRCMYETVYELEAISEHLCKPLRIAIELVDEVLGREEIQPTELRQLQKAARAVRRVASESMALLIDFHLANPLIDSHCSAQKLLILLQDAAVKARTDKYRYKPHRNALNNLLGSLCRIIDPIAYRNEILQCAEIVRTSPRASVEDLLLAASNEYNLHAAARDMRAAKQSCKVLRKLLLQAPEYTLGVATVECEIAYLEQDWSAMRRAAEVALAAAGQEVESSDADLQMIRAAHACALAKLGVGGTIAGRSVLKRNPYPKRQAKLDFYRYWCEFHLEMGKPKIAHDLALECIAELGAGRFFLETEAYQILVRTKLAMDASKGELNSTLRKARSVAAKLKYPRADLDRIDLLANVGSEIK